MLSCYSPAASDERKSDLQDTMFAFTFFLLWVKRAGWAGTAPRWSNAQPPGKWCALHLLVFLGAAEVAGCNRHCYHGLQEARENFLPLCCTRDNPVVSLEIRNAQKELQEHLWKGALISPPPLGSLPGKKTSIVEETERKVAPRLSLSFDAYHSRW